MVSPTRCLIAYPYDYPHPYPFVAYSTTRTPRMSWECPGNEQR